VRAAAVVGFKSAIEVWKSLDDESPFEPYPFWDPKLPLGDNLSRSCDFALIGVAVLGVAKRVVNQVAPRDPRLREGIEALERWVDDHSSAAALGAKQAIQKLAPGGRAPKAPVARVLVTALGVPALLNRLNEARDASWHDYVKDHPEAGGGTKRDWMRKLEQIAAREGLSACCREALAVLPGRELDLVIRGSIVGSVLPSSRSI